MVQISVRHNCRAILTWMDIANNVSPQHSQLPGDPKVIDPALKSNNLNIVADFNTKSPEQSPEPSLLSIVSTKTTKKKLLHYNIKILGRTVSSSF